MPTEYFGPLEDQGFGVGPTFNYDKFKQWLEGQQLNFKRTLAIQGDLLGNWNGDSPLDLSSIDTIATTGFAADASEGNVQFNGSVFAAGIALFDAQNDNTQVGAIGGSNDELLINNVGSKDMRLQTLTGGDIKLQPGSGGRVTFNDGSDDLWTFRLVNGFPQMEWRPTDLTNFGFISMGATNIGGGDIGTISIQAPYDDGQVELTIFNAASGDGGSRVSFAGRMHANAFRALNDGSGSAPAFHFDNEQGAGMYRIGSNNIGWITGNARGVRIDGGSNGFFTRINAGTGAFRLDLGGDGSVSAPPYAFFNDPDTGLYRTAADQVSLAAGGTQVFNSGVNNTVLPIAGADTTGSAATAVLLSSGRLQRSTSSLKYKPGWMFADEDVLADLELPTPITWESEGQTYLGFGVEHIHAMLEAATQDDYENYDVRSLVAILSAKIKRLENVPAIRAQLEGVKK